MAFTAITDRDICLQDGTGAFNFIASGTILKGQAVEIVAGDYVIATDSNPAHGFVGVADATKYKGSSLAVWGPGNIVWGRASGTGIAAGDPVQATVNGEFQDALVSSQQGVALTTQSTADGVVKILLY